MKNINVNETSDDDKYLKKKRLLCDPESSIRNYHDYFETYNVIEFNCMIFKKIITYIE